MIVLALGLAAGTGWLLVSVKPLIDEARAAVDGFHASYETGAYDSIYDGSHVSLQEGLTRADALARLGEIHVRMGNVREVSFACFTTVSTPDGKHVRVEYTVAFDNGDAWESYDWRYENGEPRLLAYAVEVGYEDGEPDWEVYLAPAGIRPNAGTCAEDGLLWWER